MHSIQLLNRTEDKLWKGIPTNMHQNTWIQNKLFKYIWKFRKLLNILNSCSTPISLTWLVLTSTFMPVTTEENSPLFLQEDPLQLLPTDKLLKWFILKINKPTNQQNPTIEKTFITCSSQLIFCTWDGLESSHAHHDTKNTVLKLVHC